MLITAHRIYFIAFTLFDVLIAVKQTLNWNWFRKIFVRGNSLKHDEFSLPQSVDLKQEKAKRPLAAELDFHDLFYFLSFTTSPINFFYAGKFVGW